VHSWEKPATMDTNEDINGHTVYGATNYPHEIKEKSFGIYIIALLAVAVIGGVIYAKKKMKVL